jgi:hypothetical protein
MYMKFKWLSPLLNADGEIGAVSEESLSVDSSEIAAEQTQEPETTAPNETPAEDISKSASFAKRLSEEKVKWEKETVEKYKDYDLHKNLSGYLSEINGGEDLLSLKERVELERLEARAEKENVPPEVLKRIDELEAKAAKGDKLEQDQQENQRVTTYFSAMDKFLEGKGAKTEELNQFMVDNKLQYDPANMEKSFDIAYKAMKADEFEKKANEKEAETIKRYLASKSGVKVEGSAGAAAAQTVDTRKMSWAEIDRHAAERVKAMNTPQ